MIKVEIGKISCCGANELLNQSDIISFLKRNPKAEIGIGVSEEKGGFGTPRFDFVKNLFSQLENGAIALHINGEWSNQIANLGEMPKELNDLIKLSPKKFRMQINFVGSGFANSDNADNLAKLVEKYFGKVKFIIPYGEKSSDFVNNLFLKTRNFDVLYDSSFGTGKAADSYPSKFAGKLVQGYAGGLSPENICEKLDNIEKIQNIKTPIWIDAESKLRKDDQNTLALEKSQKFVDSVLAWQEKRRNQEKSFCFFRQF